MKEQLDKATLQAFTEGKTGGFNAIFNLYYTAICYFCEKLTSSAEEGEDIAIQTFAKLFRMHRQFNTLPKIKAFLFITARNNCFDYLRHLQRKRRHEIEFTDLLNKKTTENKIIETVILKEIYVAVEQLPPQCRKIFKLLYIYGMKPAEIAKELSISQSTVRTQKKRALELLRISLANNEFAVALLTWLSFLEFDLMFK